MKGNQRAQPRLGGGSAGGCGVRARAGVATFFLLFATAYSSSAQEPESSRTDPAIQSPSHSA
ncbi:hypothetical protein C3941_16625 [Kaistia algarum]|nr:hypothetical protein C3941_16625 [Kaistia algarum]